MNLARWSRRRSWTVAGILIAVVVLAAAAVFVWPQFSGTSTNGNAGSTGTIAPGGATDGSDAGGETGGSDSADATTPDPDPPVTPATLEITPMTPSAKAPTEGGIAAQLAKPLSNKAVADLSGVVIDPETGAVLWNQEGAAPRVPASSMKLITGAALLASADPNKRLVTKVVAGDQPGQIVFVGGGDVTLSARAVGAPTILPGGPEVSDLAAQVKASGFGDVTSILLDTTYWTGPEMADGWSGDDIRGTPQSAKGYITKMQALMVDADRIDPANEDSPRTGEPAETAGKALAHALGNDDIPLSDGTAPADAKVLAQVESQPLSTLLAQALENSDNVLSEALAREVAIARGAPASFAGVSASFLQALGDLGLDTTGVVVKDGSGMSAGDQVPPELLGRVMAMAVAGKPAEQSILLTGLPLAGVSGTLANDERYTQPETKAGRGWVRAKTGSLNATYALVGYVPDVDGRILVFAFNSNGVSGNTNRYAQDALATALRLCGCSGS